MKAVSALQLCIRKTINASARQTYKKMGFNSRGKVDRVKGTTNILLCKHPLKQQTYIIVGTLDWNL